MKIACVQCNVFFGHPEWNAEAAEGKLKELAAEGIDLAVFPEAFLTGYCFDDAKGAFQAAIERDSPAVHGLVEAAERLGIVVIAGFAEREGALLYNSAVLAERGREPRFYRKSHLPDLGLDKFVEAGGELEVFDTALGKIGILVCFDFRGPEACRVLALKGAELIVLPTNWPEGAEVSAGHVGIVRAAENRVFVATCNRVGTENGFKFIGGSKIIDPTGKVIAAAGAEEETIRADIDLAEARNKRNVMIPGKYETAVFSSRRPELYGEVVEPVRPE